MQSCAATVAMLRRSCATSVRGWRSGRLDDVLAGDFDLIARNR